MGFFEGRIIYGSSLIFQQYLTFIHVLFFILKKGWGFFLKSRAYPFQTKYYTSTRCHRCSYCGLSASLLPHRSIFHHHDSQFIFDPPWSFTIYPSSIIIVILGTVGMHTYCIGNAIMTAIYSSVTVFRELYQIALCWRLLLCWSYNQFYRYFAIISDSFFGRGPFILWSKISCVFIAWNRFEQTYACSYAKIYTSYEHNTRKLFCSND